MDTDSACPAAPASADRDTILIVEDEDHVAALIACILERAHYRVRRATHGAECARLLEENEAGIALVLLDCTLPDVDGRVLFHELRHLAPGLPVIFVTGRDVSPLRVAFGAEHRVGFVPKPFFPAAVLKQVRETIGASA
ncbi:MAG TPA: response regulator [Opitutaceae bacterium]|nr:response regulator [Opitutaceae bacterium]